MSGFVAIIADDPRADVPEQAISDFADAYVALRGGRTDMRAAAGSRARVCVFDGPDPAGEPLQRRGDSWIAVGGVAHHPAPLLDAPVDELEGQFAVLRHDATSIGASFRVKPVPHEQLLDGIETASGRSLAL